MHLGKDFQLTYCTNVHPGQDWKATFKSLQDHVPKIKAAIVPNASFGLGLRLSNKASEELATGNAMQEFKDWLHKENIYIFTMNGFPYGNFHDQRVKDQVHSPDWTTTERLAYTKRLFDQLAILLPQDMDGGVSTSPISYKHWHKGQKALEAAFTQGAENMIAVALHLYDLERNTGKYMHLDIEPEPDGLLENSDEVLRFYADYLIPIGKKIVSGKLGVSELKAEELLKRYLAVCYDICHFSLAYEEPEDTFQKLTAAGIRIGKIQVSAALKVVFNGHSDKEIWETLGKFNEPTYLHQVTEQKDGKVVTYNDLPLILEKQAEHQELRAHFHVPIFLETYGKLASTQDHILKTIAVLKKDPLTTHLEVETYTWDVLPPDLKENLEQSIVRELQWLKERMGT